MTKPTLKKVFTAFQLVAVLSLYTFPGLQTNIAYAAGPIANDDSRTARVNETISINVLANDTDADGDDLDLASVNSPSGGTIVDYDVETGEIDYKAPATAGTYYFDYTATDGQATDVATVTVVVGAVQESTIANDDRVTTRENSPITISVLDNDEGENLSIVSYQQPANGSVSLVKSSVRYTPTNGFIGLDSFTYTIRGEDNNTSSANVFVTVKNTGGNTNNPPIANDDSRTARVNETISINVLANDTDADGDDLDLASVNSPSGGTIVDYDVETGEIDYKAPATAGTYYFDYTATDGQATDVATVTITVTSVTNPQTCNFDAVNDDLGIIYVGDTINFDVTRNDTGNFIYLSHGNINNASLGTLRSDDQGLFTFAAKAAGTYTFDYTVRCDSDRTNIDTATVKIVIKQRTSQTCEIDLNPEFQTVREGGEVAMNYQTTGNYADGALVIFRSITDLREPIRFDDGPRGDYRFTFTAPQVSTDTTYTYRAGIKCANGDIAFDDVEVRVTNTGGGGGSCSAVSAQNDDYRISQNQMKILDVLANDSTDSGDEPLEIDAIITDATNGTVSIVDNKIQYSPDRDFRGTDTFVYRAENDCNSSDTATVTISVGVTTTGGGGGGGGILNPVRDNDNGQVRGDDEVNLDIFNERLTRISDSKYVVSWNTNIPASSQVVYGMRSVSNPTGTCGSSDLGYQQRTTVKTNRTTTHIMVIDGLTPGAQYFFRPVSDRSDADCAKGRELTYRPVNLCEGYIKDFMKIGQYNDPREVAKLQAFLRIYEGANVRLTGIFDVATDIAVKDFQLKYYEEVLQPWGYERDEATGYVYITTRNKINEIICERDIPFTSAQLGEIAAFRNYWNNRFQGTTTVATQPLDRNFEKAAGVEALLPASTDSEPADSDDVVILGGTDSVLENSISDDEFFLDSVINDNESTGETSAEREVAQKSVAAAATGGIVSFIFSLPFLLTVLGILVIMLIYEIIKDRKSKKEVADDIVIIDNNGAVVPTKE